MSEGFVEIVAPPITQPEEVEMFEYRSIQIGNTDVWTVQRFRDLGTSAVGPQLCGVFYNQFTADMNAQTCVTAKHLADAAASAFAGIDGVFSPSNDPFDV